MTDPRPAPLVVRAPAKINLGLEIQNRRPDGYHDLITLYQAIRLFDTVELQVEESPGIRLEVFPRRLNLCPPAENLAVRAAEGYFETLGPRRGLSIQLRKRIPVGSGLGGGSSDAAAVLCGLAVLDGLARSACGPLAARLGSDVPFFLSGGTQLGTGRGEQLAPAPECPRLSLVLVCPGVHSSTKRVYSALNLKLTHSGVLSSLAARSFPAGFWKDEWMRLHNDLESVVCRLHPEVESVLGEMRRLSSTFARVTGSGAAVYAVAPNRRAAAVWAREFRSRGLWARRVSVWRQGCTVQHGTGRGL